MEMWERAGRRGDDVAIHLKKGKSLNKGKSLHQSLNNGGEHGGRKGRHYYTSASQANSSVYSSGGPPAPLARRQCVRHANI
ncbi:MAG TPA: hypothetical protein VK140_00555 [Ktedonobacteraceae bacterium]|nr:hypothetical protein [Ktedonobacteraceae bacterium]